jgi:hypothetical protein
VDLFRTIRCRVAIQAEQLADAARDLLPWGVTHAPTYRLEVEQGALALLAVTPVDMRRQVVEEVERRADLMGVRDAQASVYDDVVTGRCSR